MISIALKKPVILALQHHMNSLHVFSYMCRMGISRGKARKAAKLYEQFVHPFLYA